MKKDAWLNVENEFKGHSIATYHTATVLKIKYENIKCNGKKTICKRKLG